MVELQKEDVVTEEPISTKFSIESETRTEVSRDGIQKRDIFTQEPTFPKLFVEVATQTEVAATMMEEEVVTLSIQSEKVETFRF